MTSPSLRVELVHIEPPIRRRVAIKTVTNLQTLCRIIQAAMGGLDYHLWELTAHDKPYGVPDPGMPLGGTMLPRSTLMLARMTAGSVTVFDYACDMGVREIQAAGVTGLRAIASGLDAGGVHTARGGAGRSSAAQRVDRRAGRDRNF